MEVQDPEEQVLIGKAGKWFEEWENSRSVFSSSWGELHNYPMVQWYRNGDGWMTDIIVERRPFGNEEAAQ
jgi:hypothetical protein